MAFGHIEFRSDVLQYVATTGKMAKCHLKPRRNGLAAVPTNKEKYHFSGMRSDVLQYVATEGHHPPTLNARLTHSNFPLYGG